MKQLLLTLLILAQAATLTAQTNELPRSTAAAQGVEPRALARFIDSLMAVPRTHIHHLMVLRHGKVIAEAHPAPYRADDLHTLFSVSKTFTAIAVGMAVDENRLRVSDRVATFFPDKLPPQVTPELARLTVHDLLVMHSGITPDGRIRNNSDDWVAAFLARDIDPQAPYQYDSMCTFVLAAIVQRVTGTTLLSYLQERLFTPLGITQVDWESSPDGINTGGWGLRLQAESQAKFAQFILNRGMWNGRQLVSEQWIDLMCAKHIDPKPVTTPPDDGNQGYGYQIWMCKMPGALRADGAFAQYIVMVPRLDLAVVINSVSYRLNGWLELGHIWDILAPAVHDTPLAASPREQALVEQAIARGEKNEITPARGKAKSPEKWGKFRHFDLQLDSNVLNLERMALTLDKGLMQVDMNGVTTAIAAHGKWHEHLGTPAPLPPYNVKARNRMAGLTPDFRCAASYAWQDGHTLVLRMEWPTWYAGRTLTLDLQARTLTIVNNWAQQSPIVIPVTAVTH